MMDIDKIREYVRAREDEIAAYERGDGMQRSVSDREAAWNALETGLFLWTDEDEGEDDVYFMASAAEDRFVFMPLLTEEMDGNSEAAKVAWFLGARPKEYPRRDRDTLFPFSI